MKARILSVVSVGILLGLVAAGMLLLQTGQETPTGAPPIQLTDDPTFDDSRYRSKTFSLAIADLNCDRRDDVLIGAHNQDAVLLLNAGAGFTDQSGALPPTRLREDRHGYTVADFDNDGRLDIAIAGGGTDGVGAGWPNVLLRNTTEADALRFVGQPVGAEFALSPGRSRALIPLPSDDGRAVDLYYATLQRDGYDNRLLRNIGGTGEQPFKADPDHFLSRKINDSGRGALADLDGDGGRDYLLVENERVKIFWHRDGGASPTILTHAARTAVLADFDNDGMLDVFVGRMIRESQSDRITFAGNDMIFTLHKNAEFDDSEVSFSAKSEYLKFDLSQWVPASRAQRLASTAHIFMGRDRHHPGKRKFVLERADAEGQPGSTTAPGIYIWYLPADDTWHMRYVFPPRLNVFKGGVRGVGLEELARENFTTTAPSPVADQFFLNRGGGQFARLSLFDNAHSGITQGATVADFNNDGWLDVLGVRHAEQGDRNLPPFLLTNLGKQHGGGITFVESFLPERERDLLHRADQVAHGFFNHDDLPDAFVTNGFGQIPGANGVPRLLMNTTDAVGRSLLVTLRGASANRFGLGAAVSLYRGGDLLGYRVAGLNINLSQDTSWLHFGLGEGEGPYRLVVEWPDGERSEHEFAGAGRFEVVQGGVIVSDPSGTCGVQTAFLAAVC
ncbi:MAG: CRTAC1 family protein [Halioglobus sp.]|nr:CRTAC1 family protein [Halioglobus sp.]